MADINEDPALNDEQGKKNIPEGKTDKNQGKHDVPKHLQKNYELIKLGEENIDEFKKKVDIDLKGSEEQIKKEYERLHETLKDIPPEEVHRILRTDEQYNLKADRYKKMHSDVLSQRHRLSSDPKEFLDELKRDFESRQKMYEAEQNMVHLNPLNH